MSINSAFGSKTLLIILCTGGIAAYKWAFVNEKKSDGSILATGLYML